VLPHCMQSSPAKDGCASSGNVLQALHVAHAGVQAPKSLRQPAGRETVPSPTLSGHEVALECCIK